MAAVFKTRLKTLMLQKGVKEDKAITQKEVAEQTGVSLPTIGRWYNGNIDRVEADTVDKLASYFQCEMGDLLLLHRAND